LDHQSWLDLAAPQLTAQLENNTSSENKKIRAPSRQVRKENAEKTAIIPANKPLSR